MADNDTTATGSTQTASPITGLTFGEDTVYDVKEVAEKLGVNKWYITSRAQKGELNVTQLGLKTFIKGSEVNKLLAGSKMKKRVVPPRKPKAPVAAASAEATPAAA